MLTVWILFKSFKRVHRRNLLMVFSVSSVLRSGREGFDFLFCGNFGNVLECSVQSTSPIFKKKQSPFRSTSVGWLSRVQGRGEHYIFNLKHFLTICSGLLYVCLSVCIHVRTLFFIHQFISSTKTNPKKTLSP